MDVRARDRARQDDDTVPIDLRDDEDPDRDGVISGLATLAREWGTWPSARIAMVARAVILAAGILLLVMGAVALLRSGGFIAGLFGAHVTVGWLHHTPLLGIVHMAVGVGLLATASVTVPGDGSEALVGALFVVFGLITLIEPGGLHEWLATHPAHGSTYVVIGLAVAARDFASG
ncbi:MAG: hypothetical protein ACRDUY_09030 [Nitriliruptorales bacterium]